MSSFRLCSDLHLEFLESSKLNIFINKSVLLQKERKADYLILAGDICSFDTNNKLERLLFNLSPLYKHIFYVVGNHEFYLGDSNCDKSSLLNDNYYNNVIKGYKNICSKFNNVILLNNSSFRIKNPPNNHIIVYGTPLWTNINEQTYLAMNDKRTLSHSTILAEHIKSVNGIRDFLGNDGDDENVKKIIITHHVPVEELLDEKYKDDKYYSKYISGYASNIGREIIDNLDDKLILFWLYGHTHKRSYNKMGNIEFICNPYGYPNENGDYKAGRDLKFFEKYDLIINL